MSLMCSIVSSYQALAAHVDPIGADIAALPQEARQLHSSATQGNSQDALVLYYPTAQLRSRYVAYRFNHVGHLIP